VLSGQTAGEWENLCDHFAKLKEDGVAKICEPSEGDSVSTACAPNSESFELASKKILDEARKFVGYCVSFQYQSVRNAA
ncbi:MAG TPA: hypothetical protein VGL29_07670, partial [Blastocatellia bacterium]